MCQYSLTINLDCHHTRLKSRLRRIAKQHGEIGLVLVDYLQLMQVPEAKRQQNKRNFYYFTVIKANCQRIKYACDCIISVKSRVRAEAG